MSSPVDVFLLTGGAQQLVNAFEARAAFDSPRPVLVATPGLISFGARDFEAWSHISAVTLKRPRNAVARRVAVWDFERMIRQALKGVAIDRLFLGHYGEVFRAIAHATQPREVVLLDDGTAVIKAARDRKAALAGQTMPAAPLRTRLRRMLAPGDIRRLTFFSAYSPELGPEDRLVVNAYEWARRSSAAMPPRPQIDFLGQPLWKNGDIAPAAYWKAVMRLVAPLPLPVRYLCHASEDIDAVRQQISGLSVDVARPMRPYELQLVSDGAPASVLGFASSALVSAAAILGQGSVVSFEIPEAKIVSGARRREIFRGIYASFAQNPAIEVRRDDMIWGGGET